MSAIWGIIEKKIQSVQSAQTSLMRNHYEKHCRIDRIEEFQNDSCYMACGIQHFTPEASSEHLPVSPGDGRYVLTADVVLDNREELIAELVREQILTTEGSNNRPDRKRPAVITDGFLLQLAFERWNYDFVKHLKGLFAIAIYDTEKRELFLCTDQISNRCLYYYCTDSQLVFSTMLTPIRLLHPEIRPNRHYHRDFLIAPGLFPGFTSDESPWEDVKLLEAGTFVLINPDGIRKTEYWKPENIPVSGKIRDAEKQFLSIYRTAVHRALRTSGEVGIALSSGCDSSSVAALAATELKSQEKQLHSYTYIPHYKIKPKYYEINDETDGVKALGRMYPNIDMHFTDQDGRDFTDTLSDLIETVEIPFKSFINLSGLAEIYEAAYRKGCRVFLSGQNGNSTVSYGYADDILYDLYRKKKPLRWLRLYNRYCKNAGYSRKKYFRHLWSIYRRADRIMKDPPIDRSLLNSFLSPKLFEDYDLKSQLPEGIYYTTEYCPGEEQTNKALLYCKCIFSFLGVMDTKMSLRYGLLLRDPTRDPDLLSFCNSVPYEYFAWNGNPRYFIREAMKEFLPKEITAIHAKIGIQNADWLTRMDANAEHVRKLQLSALKNAPSCVKKDEIFAYINDHPRIEEKNREQELELCIIFSYMKYCNLYAGQSSSLNPT